MNQFETGAVRDTGGKGRMDLLPMCALLRVSKHMEDALTHYPERNWEMGLPMHSMLDSAMRHLAKYMDGQTDEDHLCAAATNLLMALWTEEKRPDMQDIPARKKKGGKGGNGGVGGVVTLQGGSSEMPQGCILVHSGSGPMMENPQAAGGGSYPLSPGDGGLGVKGQEDRGRDVLLAPGGGEPVCEYFNKYGRCNATKETELCLVGGRASKCFRMAGTADTEEPNNTEV